MNEEDNKTLKREQRKWEAILRGSQRLERIHAGAKIDFDMNPFCVGKQETDRDELRALNRNRIIKESTMNCKGMVQLKQSKLTKILNNALAEPQNHKQQSRMKPQKKSITFGHRPSSASRHIDYLSTSHSSIGRLAPTGLLNSEDLATLLSPKIAKKASKRKFNNGNKQIKEKSKSWDDSLSIEILKCEREALNSDFDRRNIPYPFCDLKNQTDQKLIQDTQYEHFFNDAANQRRYLNNSKTIHTVSPRN